MSATMTADRAYQQMREHAERIKNDEDQHVGEMSVNDFWAQGDVAIRRIPDRAEWDDPLRMPSNMAGSFYELDAATVISSARVRQPCQLAPGNTQGSRHTVEAGGDTGVDVLWFKERHPLIGMVIEAKKPFTVAHPEHGNAILREGTYLVVYERAYADVLRAVRD